MSDKPIRRCRICDRALPAGKRGDAEYCTVRCKSAARRGTNPSAYRRPRWISAVRVSDNPDDPVEIQLIQGQWAKVDLKDLGLVISGCWCFSRTRSSGYAVRIGPGHRTILMHRVILGLADDDPRQPDHINHDTLDNRRDNFRVATRAQNSANARKRDRVTSRYKGCPGIRTGGSGGQLSQVIASGDSSVTTTSRRTLLVPTTELPHGCTASSQGSTASAHPGAPAGEVGGRASLRNHPFVAEGEELLHRVEGSVASAHQGRIPALRHHVRTACPGPAGKLISDRQSSCRGTE
jgi:hypothetical protein